MKSALAAYTLPGWCLNKLLALSAVTKHKHAHASEYLSIMLLCFVSLLSTDLRQVQMILHR